MTSRGPLTEFLSMEHIEGMGAAMIRLTARGERAITELEPATLGGRPGDPGPRPLGRARGPGVRPRRRGLTWLVADARLAIHRGDTAAALERTPAGPGRAGRGSPGGCRGSRCHALTELARAQLLIGDHKGARVSLSQARDTVAVRPDLGRFIDDMEQVSQQALAAPRGDDSWSTLTRAELRLLPFLQTYLTIKEIGERLGVSPNTAKTQALSIYGKLGASTRSEAVEAAVARGLLEDVFAGRS